MRLKDGAAKLTTATKEIPIPVQLLGFRVKMVGHNLKVNLELIGITITWNLGQMITVETTAGLWNRTAGLCGTLDQNPLNDLVSKDGSPLKVNFNETMFKSIYF